MDLPEELVGIVFVFVAIVSGFLFIMAGIGLSLVPANVPIFGSAS
jgi:hypothetical protein